MTKSTFRLCDWAPKHVTVFARHILNEHERDYVENALFRLRVNRERYQEKIQKQLEEYEEKINKQLATYNYDKQRVENDLDHILNEGVISVEDGDSISVIEHKLDIATASATIGFLYTLLGETTNPRVKRIAKSRIKKLLGGV